MRSAPLPPSSYLSHRSLRSRAASMLLAAGISILIVVMLLKLGALPARIAQPDSPPITVTLLREIGVAKKKTPAAPKARQQSHAQVAPPHPQTYEFPPNMIMMSRQQFASSDISKVQSQVSESNNNGTDSDKDGSAGATGEGPGGSTLYNAEWYREPTSAEMAFYLPKGKPFTGWAMIACKTKEQYQVEDCRELSESPPGSGLARAVRQAAWQFKVRPPRVDGKPLIGAWVRILYKFNVVEKP